MDFRLGKAAEASQQSVISCNYSARMNEKGRSKGHPQTKDEVGRRK